MFQGERNEDEPDVKKIQVRQNKLKGSYLFFGEVPHHVRSVLVYLAHDVKEERVDVVVERLVIQKELGQQAQLLTVGLVVFAVDLVGGEVAFVVYAASWWIPTRAVGTVFQIRPNLLHVGETILTNVQGPKGTVFFGESGIVPALDFVTTHDQALNVLDFGRFVVFSLKCGVLGVPIPTPRAARYRCRQLGIGWWFRCTTRHSLPKQGRRRR